MPNVPLAILNELQRILGPYITHVLERELKSTQFMYLVAPMTRGQRG